MRKKDRTGGTDGTDGTDEGYRHEDFDYLRRGHDLFKIIDVLIRNGDTGIPDNWDIVYENEETWLISCLPKGE